MNRFVIDVLEGQNGCIALTIGNPCVQQENMDQGILLHGALAEESMNGLKTLQNILKGVAPFPDLQNLIDSTDQVPFRQEIQERKKIQMERRRTDGLYERRSRLFPCRVQNIPN